MARTDGFAFARPKTASGVGGSYDLLGGQSQGEIDQAYSDVLDEVDDELAELLTAN